MALKQTSKLIYQSPEIEILDVEIEKGFANSLEDPRENGEIDW